MREIGGRGHIVDVVVVAVVVLLPLRGRLKARSPMSFLFLRFK
jgi:hypothetical protein